MSARPTPGQLEALDYLASVVDGERIRLGSGRNYSRSAKSCVRRGWLVPIERFPFHTLTEAGRAVLAEAERVR